AESDAGPDSREPQPEPAGEDRPSLSKDASVELGTGEELYAAADSLRDAVTGWLEKDLFPARRRLMESSEPACRSLGRSLEGAEQALRDAALALGQKLTKVAKAVSEKK